MKEPYITKLPKLTPENIAGIMEKRIAATKTDVTTIPILWQGFLEMDVEVGEQARTAKVYVPKDTRQGTTFVLMNVPKGETAISFWQKSGWVDCADQSSICLFAAEPGPGGWGTPEEELPFFSACMRLLIEGVHFRGGLTIYVVGYGETGTALHKMVLASPLQIAAAAFVDAGRIDDGYLKEMEKKSLDGDGRVYGVALKDIPVPVWILEGHMTQQAEAAAVHWARAIGADTSAEGEGSCKTYQQKKSTVCTPEENIVKVHVTETQAGCCDAALTADICAFLTQYARYGKTSPIGNSLVRHVDYAAQGVEVRYFTDADGFSRECLVYVPKAFLNQGKLPMVFAVHGACESIRNYFEESLWYRKADKEGFIVVMPESVLRPVPEEISNGFTKAYRSIWNLSNPNANDSDLYYFNYVMDQLIAEYPIDVQRIYCTGHSMGNMMTNFIGSSWLGRRFAALGATCGILASWGDGKEAVPIWLNMAEYDLWDYDLAGGKEIANTIDHWLVRNGITTEENAAKVRLFGGSEVYTEDRYNGRVWKNRNGVPMICYEWIQGKDHMNTPADTCRIWNLWFSKWELDKEKGRCYEGRPCEKRRMS